MLKGKKDVVIEATAVDASEVAKRAEAVKNKLVDDGVPAARIHIVPQDRPAASIRIRVLAVAPTQARRRRTTDAPPPRRAVPPPIRRSARATSWPIGR